MLALTRGPAPDQGVTLNEPFQVVALLSVGQPHRLLPLAGSAPVAKRVTGMSATSNVSAASSRRLCTSRSLPRCAKSGGLTATRIWAAASGLSTFRQAIDGPATQRPGRRRGVAYIARQLQPAREVAGAGGGRGRVAGERLDGVAQPLGHRRKRPLRSQLPSESSASVASNSANGAVRGARVDVIQRVQPLGVRVGRPEQHDRFAGHVDHLVTANRGGDPLTSRRAAVYSGSCAPRCRTFSSETPLGRCGSPSKRSAWHPRCRAQRPCRSSPRASFVRACTRSSGGAYRLVLESLRVGWSQHHVAQPLGDPGRLLVGDRDYPQSLDLLEPL